MSFVVPTFSSARPLTLTLYRFSMNITTNENGETPFTTTCSGTSSTLPVLTYLLWTACEDAAVEFSWSTVNGTEQSPDAYYQLNIKDNKGYTGSQAYDKQALKNVATGPDAEYQPVYVLDVSKTLEVPRHIRAAA